MLAQFHTFQSLCLKRFLRYSPAPSKMSPSYLIHTSHLFPSLTSHESGAGQESSASQTPLPPIFLTCFFWCWSRTTWEKERDVSLLLCLRRVPVLQVCSITAALPCFLGAQMVRLFMRLAYQPLADDFLPTSLMHFPNTTRDLQPVASSLWPPFLGPAGTPGILPSHLFMILHTLAPC